MTNENGLEQLITEKEQNTEEHEQEITEQEQITTEKKYLGILTTYNVRWPPEKTARDLFQNFFDGNKGTFDGIKFGTDEKITIKETYKRKFLFFKKKIQKEEFDYCDIEIRGKETYDHRLLLHLGGTTKKGKPETAGEFGEGAKIAALILLRDYKFSKVQFGSQDWTLDFILDDLPEGEYHDKKVKGLFAKITKNPQQQIEGNYVKLKAHDKKHIKAFKIAKKWFYHKRHEEFANPVLDIQGVGGFSLTEESGNFYLCGQRRPVKRNKWNTLDNISLWIWNKDILNRDRDRSIVTSEELEKQVIKYIINSAKQKQLEEALWNLEPIWAKRKNSSRKNDHTGGIILEYIIEKLASKKATIEFPEKYFAKAPSKWNKRRYLKKYGYIEVNPKFEKLGMRTTEQLNAELEDFVKIHEYNKTEKNKIKILYQTAKQITKQEPLEIILYDSKGKSLDALYSKNCIWMSRKTLKKPYAKATSTYLHELAHQRGQEGTKNFNHSITQTLENTIDQIIKNPQKYEKLRKKWD